MDSLRSPILLALALLGACSPSDPRTSPRASEVRVREATRVRTRAVEKREMVRRLETTTVVESDREIPVMPRRGGTIVEVRAEEGDEVAAGQVLAVIDPRDALSALEEARIALREAQDNAVKADIIRREAEGRLERARLTAGQAERDFKRNEKTGLVAQRDLDALRLAQDTTKHDREAAELALDRTAYEVKASATALERSELRLAREELNLSHTEVTAPFAGTVALRTVRLGDSVTTASPLFVLTDGNHLRAIFHRPQRELDLFTPATGSNGQTASGLSLEVVARSEALPGIDVRGRILRVSPTIDATSGSFRVTVDLSPRGAGPRLLPGMLVRLEIITDRHADALVVPKRALRREGEAVHLFVLRDGSASRVDVTIGYAEGNFTEVVPAAGQSLQTGDRVIVVGNRDLEEGDEVTDEPMDGPMDGTDTTETVPGESR
jgi:membrane fusion protein (multidrug efflux system)